MKINTFGIDKKNNNSDATCRTWRKFNSETCADLHEAGVYYLNISSLLNSHSKLKVTENRPRTTHPHPHPPSKIIKIHDLGFPHPQHKQSYHSTPPPPPQTKITIIKKQKQYYDPNTHTQTNLSIGVPTLVIFLSLCSSC